MDPSVACENIRLSSLFVAGDVSRGERDVPPRETSPTTRSKDKRMFSQANPSVTQNTLYAYQGSLDMGWILRGSWVNILPE